MTNDLHIPALSLVVLIGASGSGKSTFGVERFAPFEVVSSDFCRALVSGDENNQAVSADAFDVLNFIVGKRLDAGLLTVVDATSVQPAARKALIELARAHDVLPVAIVLDPPLSVCLDRNARRTDRTLDPAVIRRQHDQLRRSQRGLGREGFRTVHRLITEEEIADARIVRDPLRTDLRGDHGPFDVIGDIHGCRSELETLLERLGYVLVRDDAGRPVDAAHPEGRRVIFLGDLVDRGPDSVGVLRLAMGMSEAGHALAVPGNHEQALISALDGRRASLGHGLAETLAQLNREPEEFRRAVRDWMYALVSHLVLDDGNLVVAHAGLIERYQGRSSGRVRSFALYGDTTGGVDEYGLPVRLPWADDYRGSALVLYGHTPVRTARWVNNTMCLDTACVYGGSLTAMNYPEKTLVSVPAERRYADPIRPLDDGVVEDIRGEDELRLTDVLGRRSVQTALMGRISIREENAAGALETMSRFALSPQQIPYLPPTMSPVETSAHPDYLEHPAEAFAQFAKQGVREVICEEKHMGSRTVVLLCRDAEIAARRFHLPPGSSGSIYTRTGRAVFEPEHTEQMLAAIRSAVGEAGLWDELQTDWILFDGEMMPWSLKATELLQRVYAPTGAAARSSLGASLDALAAAQARGVDVAALTERTAARLDNAERFTAAYRHYVWPVNGLDGVEFAPFQILATEGATHYERDHRWHLELLDRCVVEAPGVLRRTRRLSVDTADEVSVAAGIRWWTDLTAAGGEGMVVKPMANTVRMTRGLVQPGVKVRGREYLRIIYGPDYTEPANLSRLKERSLGLKRSLALREYALGVEALTRLVAGEPLWRVHEAVFAVLALESEAVDPRL